jgi:hypothetical protein
MVFWAVNRIVPHLVAVRSETALKGGVAVAKDGDRQAPLRLSPEGKSNKK